MLTRPTPQTVGLTEEHLETLRTVKSRRDHLLYLIASRGTVILSICFVVWALLPLNTENTLARLALVAFLSLIGWAFVMGILYAVSGLFLRKPKQYEKVESYDRAVLDFEKDWRKHYLKSFWDSVSFFLYHAEPENDFPKVRLGFLDHWCVSGVSFFFVLKAKRHIFYTVPENATLDKRTACKAVDALKFYSADVLCLLSPNGFSEEAVAHLAKNYPDQFLVQIGKEAIETMSWLKTIGSSAPAVPLDVYAAASDLSQVLRDWRSR